MVRVRERERRRWGRLYERTVERSRKGVMYTYLPILKAPQAMPSVTHYSLV